MFPLGSSLTRRVRKIHSLFGIGSWRNISSQSNGIVIYRYRRRLHNVLFVPEATARSMERIIHFLRQPLNGWQYALWGFSLMGFKYIVELLLILLNGGDAYSPLAFVLPFSTLRVEAIAGAPSWVTWFILLWSLPFVFIAIVLSVRRFVDAGSSPWMAMWILCPFVNLIFMVGMCFAPTSDQEVKWKPFGITPAVKPDPELALMYALGHMLVGLGITMLVLLASIYLLADYGASIFFSSPILLGVICGYSQTRRTGSASAWGAIGVSFWAIILGCGILIVLAFEGVVCIFMALPIMLPAAALGGLVGHLIAVSTSAKGPSWMILVMLMPSSAVIEHALTQPSLFEVVSVVEVDAPVEEVWQQVVAFPEITSPPGTMFWLGVAYPVRARIEGTGVGAVRYCEFSTGDFVEPITVWDQPHHLAFSVEDQPCPLTELSPYEAIHPPHLDGFLRSHQGEFRLTKLPNGRTRLEGHTWYSVDMYPQLYWKVWTDSIIHAIHHRVLDHIRIVSESAEASPELVRNN